MTPTLDRVLVREFKDELTKRIERAGLIATDSHSRLSGSGVVLAVSAGWHDEDGIWRTHEVEVGDHVIFAECGGYWLDRDEGLRFVRHDELLARKEQ